MKDIRGRIERLEREAALEAYVAWLASLTDAELLARYEDLLEREAARAGAQRMASGEHQATT